MERREEEGRGMSKGRTSVVGRSRNEKAHLLSNSSSDLSDSSSHETSTVDSDSLDSSISAGREGEGAEANSEKEMKGRSRSGC